MLDFKGLTKRLAREARFEPSTHPWRGCPATPRDPAHLPAAVNWPAVSVLECRVAFHPRNVYPHQSRVLQRLDVRQVAQRLEPEFHQKLLRRHIGVGRPSFGLRGPAAMSPSSRSAAIRSREISRPNISENSPSSPAGTSPPPSAPPPRVLSAVLRRPGCRRRRAPPVRSGTGVERKTFPCPDELDRPPAKIFAQVVEQSSSAQSRPTTRARTSRVTASARRTAPLRRAPSIPANAIPAAGRRARGRSRVPGSLSAPSVRARRAEKPRGR